MKKLTIRLSKEIMEQVNNNTLKTKTMIKYLLDNVEGATTKKAIDKTSMLDIDFSGKQAKNAMIDTWTQNIIINF